MSTVHVLQNAKDLLQNGEKWVQHKYYDRLTGKRCLLGAVLANNIPVNIGRKAAIGIIRNVINDMGWDGGNIAQFNDHITRRWADIAEVLDQAIERAQHGYV